MTHTHEYMNELMDKMWRTNISSPLGAWVNANEHKMWIADKAENRLLYTLLSGWQTEDVRMERIVYAIKLMPNIGTNRINANNSWVVVLCTITDMEMIRIAIKCEDECGLSTMVGSAGLDAIWEALTDSNEDDYPDLMKTQDPYDNSMNYISTPEKDIRYCKKIVQERAMLTLHSITHAD